MTRVWRIDGVLVLELDEDDVRRGVADVLAVMSLSGQPGNRSSLDVDFALRVA